MTVNETERKIYLSPGKWRDYWTKEETNGGWFTVATNNIPVFEKVV